MPRGHVADAPFHEPPLLGTLRLPIEPSEPRRIQVEGADTGGAPNVTTGEPGAEGAGPEGPGVEGSPGDESPGGTPR